MAAYRRFYDSHHTENRHRHAHTQADIHAITILRSPVGGGVVTRMTTTDCVRSLKVELGLADGISAIQLSSDGRPGSSLARMVVL